MVSYSLRNALMGEDESRKPPPAHTPGQAEGSEGDVDPNREREEPIRREKPSQAEGEDQDRKPEVPEED